MSTETLEAPQISKFTRCYYLGDYEDNGYHDSYFHVVYWNDVEGKIENKEYAATAYGGGWNYEADLLRDIPNDVAERIKAHRIKLAVSWAVENERLRVMEPEPNQMPFGSRVRITKTSRKNCNTPYAANDVGEVFGHYWFGQFYGNGYNKKTRDNGRCGVRLVDGRKVFCPMTAVRLDCEPDIAKATEKATNNWKLRCPHAWWSKCNTDFCA